MSAATTPEPPPKAGTGDVWVEVVDACDEWIPGYHDVWAWWMWAHMGEGPTDPESLIQRAPPGLRLDMLARRYFGIKKHGTPLQRDNDRRHMVDAYQEALDLTVYLWAARASWWIRWSAVLFAWLIRRRLPTP